MGFVLSISRVVSIFVFGFWVLNIGSHAQVLPPEEVQALKTISTKLQNKCWNNISESSCTNRGLNMTFADKDIICGVACNCSFESNTVCHVTNILLKRLNLAGVLPAEFGNLPYLQEIDLTRNYLSGTIPKEWGSTKLVNISLIGNRLTGPIPKEIANISTLTSLTVEYNQLSGSLPPELGNLTRIERLFLNSNNFTGELPATLAKLTTLKDFRISDNHFTGKIPNFIENWTKLETLKIQASGLDGPIPSGIALLENLTDLRISDLNGTKADFPQLNIRAKMKTLILRSCNLNGELPEYLGDMTKLKVLDLTFNNLSGEIPDKYANLVDVDYIYLTGNLLSGPVPDWMKTVEHIDLSYNNFGSTEACQDGTVNLFGSSLNDNSGNVTCYTNIHCPPQKYDSLYINCGGKEVTANGNMYEGDTAPAGPSTYFSSRTNWAVSSTGHFLDNQSPGDNYILTNTSILSMKNSELYMNARLSPISLTYYAFCMINGNYTVYLHFAEIKFTDDKTYRSLGRRMFDVYIQGKLVLKDFNIEDKAGGVGKEHITNSTAIVTNNTLEIRFYWAGKGTDGIPDKGVYGPLISAIAVEPDFELPSEKVPWVIIVSAAAAFVAILFLSILWWKVRKGRKYTSV